MTEERAGRSPLLRIIAAAALFVASAATAHGETTELRVSKGFGMHYLPLYVMEHEKLVEKHAAEAGLGTVTLSWPIIDGGNNINDAMLAGALDIASIGVPGFLTLWAKAKGTRFEILGLSAIGGGSLTLSTRNPAVKSLKDFTDADRIALPGVKSSFAAVILQMVVAKEFGDANYAKLDPLTVGMPYPEAVTALTSGKTEITAHVASPPFSFIELDHPAIHRVFNSAEVLGPTTVIMAHTTRAFYERNPKLCAAFIAAVEEATQLIAEDRQRIARLYNEMATVKTSEAMILRILDDPDIRYGVAPDGVMMFATFMHRVGTIKTKPERWQDVFFPALHDRAGS
jgi:NitT/TauT family transport system substrate-binding protein